MLGGQNEEMLAQIKGMGPFSALLTELPLANEYKNLEPPGEEPPEELLTVFKKPEEDHVLRKPEPTGGAGDLLASTGDSQ